MKVCIVGASGKLGRYMVGHALDRGYEVVGVCRPQERLEGSVSSRVASPSSPDERMTETSFGRPSRDAGACLLFWRPGESLITRPARLKR